MHRRSFITTAGLAVTAGLVGTACSDGSGGEGSAGQASGRAIEDLPGVEEQTLAVIAASLEFLTGPDRWLAFGVVGLDRSPLAEDRDVEIYLRTLTGNPEEQGEVLLGPLQAQFAPPADAGQGVYYVQTDLEEEGLFEVVAISGDDFGIAAVQVVDPANSQVKAAADGAPLVPGAMAVSAPTPTTSDDMGVFAICTQDPPCGMHEMSLAEALETEQPVVLMFATPQFCQTAVCGPSVATLEQVRDDGDYGDAIFIHSEIFAEEPTGANVATTPVTEAVAAWGLPTEPWLFTIRPDGTIAGRLDGPMPAPVLQSLVEELTA